ncbi:MAG: hypothetical protein JST26_09910 [Bacteroidetes bacterium]|nr:hypothetical protein [Bacteroidota bacterium]
MLKIKSGMRFFISLGNMKHAGTYLKMLFLMLVLTACQKCKKDPEAKPNYHFEIPQELWDYGCFKPGTYWVYEDSISHIIDSVWVFKANGGNKTISESNDYPYTGTFGWYSCWSESSYDHYQYENWVDQTWNVNYSDKSITALNREKYSTANSSYNTGQTILMANANLNKKLGTYPDYTEYVYLYNIYSENGLNFSSVEKWYNSKSIIDDKQNTNYYIARNIGIIRREQADSNHVWKLVRYHIVQ